MVQALSLGAYILAGVVAEPRVEYKSSVNLMRTIDLVCVNYFTDPKTTPLKSIELNPRNITDDYITERKCLKILGYPDIPRITRIKIHEGLAYISLRHVHMGYTKLESAMFHFSELTKLAPGFRNYSMTAAFLGMEIDLCKHDLSISLFNSLLYGKASSDPTYTRSDLEDYKIRRGLAFTLGDQFNRLLPRLYFMNYIHF